MAARFRFLLLPLTLLSWVLLLLASLSHTEQWTVSHPWPAWVQLFSQAGLAAGAFLYFRYQPTPLRGQDFVGLLRRLVLGPGLLAGACLGLHLLAQALVSRIPAYAEAFYVSAYTLNLGLFIFFLARVNYAWRGLVHFKSTAITRRSWEWLEVLLGATLLFQLLGQHVPRLLGLAVVVGLGLFGVYLSGNQRWVAHLTQRQKQQVVALQAALLGAMLLFVQYFRGVGYGPELLTPEPQQAFLVLTAFFAAFYATMGLLVTLFNMPTAGVFEQRRAEILSLQRLTQIIQRGQTEDEIYDTLLTSAVQTVQADGALLVLHPHAAEAAHKPPHIHNLTPEQATAVQAFVQLHGVDTQELVRNDLAAAPAWPTGLPFGSLATLPLRGMHHHYGALCLLKADPQGFDLDDLGILRTFTSQTVLSIENLQLVADSLASQRTQEELKIASQVQDSLIPKKLPTDNWFDISSHSLAAKEVGGDFYDFLHLPGRRLAVLIGDVSGKGVTAAFHMAQMKGIFHALMQENPLARSERDKFPVPSRFMVQANTALTHCLERSSFITSTLYIIDYEQGGFVFARAGHCHTLYYHAMREEVFYFESSGLGLGIIRNEGYEKHIKNQFYDYGPGDVMVIYTDGIVEARGAGAAEYGEDRLKERLEECFYMEAEEIKDYLLRDVNTFTTGQPIHDDQTLLVIKFKTAQPAPLA